MHDSALPSVTMPDSDPASMPEVQRELTMLNGAIQSLDKATRDLLESIQPIIRQEKEADSAKIPLHEALPVNTDVGRKIAELRATVSRLEEAVTYTRYRVQV